MTTTVQIDASQGQYTPAGKLLGKMYYEGFLRSVLSHKEYRGCPHDGAYHSLMLMMNPLDLSPFFSLIREAFPSHEGVEDFIGSVKAELTRKYPAVQAA